VIYTTKGWLPDEAVELRVTVQETDTYKATRTDKHLRESGEWVGNDVHMEIKQPLQMWGTTESLNG